MNQEEIHQHKDQLKQRIEDRWGQCHQPKGKGRMMAGFLLVVIGGLLLLKTTDMVIFPNWFFTWPMFLIALGLFTGIRHGFRGGFWIPITLIGGVFLINRIDPSLQLNRYIAPAVIICIGLLFILRPKGSRWRRRYLQAEGQEGNPALDQTSSFDNQTSDRRDFLDVTAIFGGVKKIVLSKTFKGGDIVSFMGGSEIDLTQADFEGRIKIDTTNIFGGTKLVVPPGWDVQSEMVAIFGGVDDKRQIKGVHLDPNKVLILDGTCIFGGIEIRSY